MNNNEVFIVAQNIELASLRIAQVRQVLLDHSSYFEWQQLIEASSVLDTALARLGEMLIGEACRKPSDGTSEGTAAVENKRSL